MAIKATVKSFKEVANKSKISSEIIDRVSTAMKNHSADTLTKIDFDEISKLSKTMDFTDSFKPEATTKGLKALFSEQGVSTADQTKIFNAIRDNSVDKLDDSLKTVYKSAQDKFGSDSIKSWGNKSATQMLRMDAKKIANDKGISMDEAMKEAMLNREKRLNASSGNASKTAGQATADTPIASKNKKDGDPSKFQNFVQSDWPKVIVGGGVAAYTASQLTKRNGNKGRMSNAELYNQR